MWNLGQCYENLIFYQNTGGGTYVLRQMGMWLSYGSPFVQEILKHGSFFLYTKKKKDLNMGPIFRAQIFWFLYVKIGSVFQEKSLKMGTPLCQNDP